MTNRSAASLLLSSCCLLAAGLLLVLAWAPGWHWTAALSTQPVVAHALAFPVVLGCGLLLCAVGVAWVGRRLMRRSRAADAAAPVWPRRLTVGFVFTTSLVLALTGALFIVPLPNGAPPVQTVAAASDGSATSRTVMVLSWNTQGDAATEELGELIATYQPGVIALPETEVLTPGLSGVSSDMAAYFMSNLADNYVAFQSTNGRAAPTSVLVHKSLGEYREVEGPVTAIGSVTLAPVGDSDRPTIVAVHPVPPLPGLMAEWRADVSRVVQWGEAHSGPLIMAGDFNATHHHGAMTQLDTLQDARDLALNDATSTAEQSSAKGLIRGPGRGVLRGTWPRNLPALFGATIDHVLVKGGPKLVTVELFDVVAQPKSDHRAVVAQLVFE